MANALFNGFCYPSIDAAVQAEISLPMTFGTTQTVIPPATYVVIGANATITYTYRSYGGGATNYQTMVRSYPTCSTVGNFQESFVSSSIDPSTAVHAFAAGATIFFPAFAFAWMAAFVVNTIRGRRNG